MYLRAAEDGQRGDRIQGRVISHVTYCQPSWTTRDGDIVHGDDCERLRLMLQTSWGTCGVPWDEVVFVDRLDRRETADRAALRRMETFPEWLNRNPGAPFDVARRKRDELDAEFDREKDEMLGRLQAHEIDVELVRAPARDASEASFRPAYRRDPRRSED